MVEARGPALRSGTSWPRNRRIAATGHTGGAGDETLDSTPSLAERHQRLMSGAMSLATADGQSWFGPALVKEGISR
jgi:hypothetical protein